MSGLSFFLSFFFLPLSVKKKGKNSVVQLVVREEEKEENGVVE